MRRRRFTTKDRIHIHLTGMILLICFSLVDKFFLCRDILLTHATTLEYYLVDFDRVQGYGLIFDVVANYEKLDIDVQIYNNKKMSCKVNVKMG